MCSISNVKLKGISAKCQRHIVKHDYLIRKHALSEPARAACCTVSVVTLALLLPLLLSLPSSLPLPMLLPLSIHLQVLRAC